MKKINNKGVTLVELIVSFALVGVAIIYFFQTLYTVKKVYATARTETNEYINKDYAYRILDAYFDNYSLFATESICSKYNLKCKEVNFINYNNRMNKYEIIWENGSKTYYYKYKGIIDEVNGTVAYDNCKYACSTNNDISDFHVSNDGLINPNTISFEFAVGIKVNDLEVEYNQNCAFTGGSYCKLKINDIEIDDFNQDHKNTLSYSNVSKISLTHKAITPGCTCYATVTKFKLN